MSRLEQLYQDMILEHNKNPRNFRALDGHTHVSHGFNPLCGDDYFVFVKMNGGTVEDVAFQGSGCAISKSSGSLMTSAIKGKSKEEVMELKDCFIGMVTQGCSEACQTKLGKLKVFEGVKQYPVRVKCAALVWRALEDALSNNLGKITTE